MTGYDRFSNEALLVKVDESTKAFVGALETALNQWRERNMFDHHALRPKAENLRETLEAFIPKLSQNGHHGRAVTKRHRSHAAA